MIKNSSELWIGLDIGSTTVKAVVLEAGETTPLYSTYLRHNARQLDTAASVLREIFDWFPGSFFRLAVCGSGGRTLANLVHGFYIQEVVANALAVKQFFPRTRVAVELGGQDAKIVFFYHDEQTGQLTASDMRMNGSCAGGTGAFIDEVAHLLKIPVEEFESYASRGTRVYDISGRCGVFAKTDIQPLLNQGVSKEDIALSTFHAIAKQTIGGLAQGLEFRPPLLFEGGPLTFNPTLIKVFGERLGLGPTDLIRPERPEILVAMGTALSLGSLFSGYPSEFHPAQALNVLSTYREAIEEGPPSGSRSFFFSQTEREDFLNRHTVPPSPTLDKYLSRRSAVYTERHTTVLPVYLGIDAGSTTTKFVLLDEEEEVVETFYANNDGEPLQVMQKALQELYVRYREQGILLQIRALGTTGYGETLFAKAFGADFHTVETVAHATAALKYVPDASFILDIGGQDMKAISLSDGIVTGIILNEACSAGCGSFLENFAKSLGFNVSEIAEIAFNARNPAELGSRCTVFMNSCIITEQKNGKSPEDIMAGLCRSIVENVFTKVVRISNFSTLGDKLVVQGGTFKNDAVLRALEQYTGKTIIRAPYPGEMGAIGIAILTRRFVQEQEQRTGTQYRSSFIGFSELESFSYTRQSGLICPFCTNNCNRTSIRFSSGNTYITGNRCERGEILGDPGDETIRQKVRETGKRLSRVPNIFAKREEFLFRDYPVTPLYPPNEITIGIPRVLEFWNSLPFWKTLWKSLGFQVVLSDISSRKLFEHGLPFVTSDTVCFPAKLVHGHIRSLLEKKVDRIFMPSIVRMPSENTEGTSDHVCAVVKGYPLVVRYSDDPARRANVPFDAPLFHWFDTRTRDIQIIEFFRKTFGLSDPLIREGIKQGDAAIRMFRESLEAQGRQLLDRCRAEGTFAVVLAGRPYHSDNLVNHDLSQYFTRQGVPVLPLDALPGLWETDLTRTRLEITNNFHARMLAGAIRAAEDPVLEYVQIVSFGCGHDAVLTDEIIRLMKEISSKDPLILKLDEGDAVGPLSLRVKSFIETVRTRRKNRGNTPIKALSDPYPLKFTRDLWKTKTILVPNVSRAFCRIATAAIRRQGFRVEPLPLGGRDAIKLGKQFVHNDICFPAQMNIGECLATLQSGQFDPDSVVLGLAKYQCDCRLAHYAALARKALDEAGYRQVPIITTDKLDTKNMYPGFKLETGFELRMLWGLVMMDILEELRRKIRPYERNKGDTDAWFNQTIDQIGSALERSIHRAIRQFKDGIDRLCKIPYDRSDPLPRVFIIGEYLLNYHPGSNFYVEEYLEKHQMEVILPRMADVFRRDYLRKISEMRDFHVRYPFLEGIAAYVTEGLFDYALNILERVAQQHPLYEPSTRLPRIAEKTDPIMHRTFTSGEGWLIPGEILHYASKGVKAFVVLQPFGCLPNHICGRGVMKRLKEEYPDIQILPLDYDPDTSFANIENRLQMLIMNARQAALSIPKESAPAGVAGKPQNQEDNPPTDPGKPIPVAGI
ncbi:MAG TPA: acyl-CoA dehydratase activase [Spirochaetales bacterium]|nr:acyl-CoA dehydratase activase [Spirochaetales bacterium]